MKSFQDSVAIVTGGANGIGGGTARRLAREGVRVLIADYLLDAAQANAERICTAGGIAEAIQTDVSRPEQIEAMVARAVELWGGVQILVNNAWGRKEPDGSALTVTESSWDYGFDVMVKAHFLAAKYAIPHMQKAGWGSIVNIASVHGILMAPNALVYDTAKAAVIGLTRQMAVDFGPIGVRVNAICPGHIVTERSQPRWNENPSLLEFFKQQYPVRRVGTPDDIANAVRFLCSDEASFITGHTLVVDGGMTIQLQENLTVNLARFYRDHPETELPA
ncbi:MAG: SDR family oxidoreductase [Caldilineaceae bacterium]|nr:SDR family oxidoreductase [Caldilineaceae bacterium]